MLWLMILHSVTLPPVVLILPDSTLFHLLLPFQSKPPRASAMKAEEKRINEEVKC